MKTSLGKTIKLRVGTCWFISKTAAIKYYEPYGYDNTAEAVERKLAEGEIHIGTPELKENQIGIFDKDGRFEIHEF